MKHLLLLLVSLIAVATIVDAWCGTANPHSHGRATCIQTDCDTEQGRAPYYYTQGSSPIYSFTVNSILFGDYYNDADLNKRYNDSMAAFKAKYMSALGMDLTIKSTFVANEYQEVNENDQALHQEMAAKYYKQGEMTVMFSNFVNGTLYGYAISPWDIDKNDIGGSFYTIITTSTGALGATNTTVFHEVGHMLGLLHVFNEEKDCGNCIERPSSPDLNSVGDFCNDTLPMGNEDNCDGTLKFPQNCHGENFASVDKLPVNNYMAYTGDECQTLGFTPQQVARARCYLATKLTFLVTATTPAAGTPAKSNTPGKASDATVVSGAAAVVVGAMAMAL